MRSQINGKFVVIRVKKETNDEDNVLILYIV